MPCTVLLVEDAEDSREVYAFYLRLQGFVVHEAADGADAVAKAIELQPDVIAMDLAMSGMDGWTATATIRAHPLTLHIPIVIVTAHAFPAHIEQARAAGAAAFLVKPLEPADLARTLRAVSEACDTAFLSTLENPHPALPA